MKSTTSSVLNSLALPFLLKKLLEKNGDFKGCNRIERVTVRKRIQPVEAYNPLILLLTFWRKSND